MMGRNTVFAGVALALVASTARADDKTCASDAALARQSRAEGKLTAALDAYRRCSSADCAERAECSKEWVATEAATPSVVVMVRDSKGRDFANAPVIVDGSLASSLDGHSILVDPGMHTFRIGAFDGIPSEQRVMIHEKEKNRVLLFFAQPIAFTVKTAVATDAPAPPRTRSTVWPWVVTGTGALTIAVGAVFTTAGIAMAQDAQRTAALSGYYPITPSTAGQYSTGAVLNHTGIGLLIGGTLVAAAGIVWHVLDRQKQVNAASRIPGTIVF